MRLLKHLASLTLLLILLAEAAFRLFLGRPQGTFDFAAVSARGTYPPYSTLEFGIGPLPYSITTNRHGLRGRDIPEEKTAGTLRIVAVGDSVTNGFYVSDAETFPAKLEEQLAGRNIKAEVLNLARGGASIGEELAALKTIGLPLRPDLVVLTFVTNDIAALRGLSFTELTNISLTPAISERALTMLLRNSALMEFSVEHALGILTNRASSGDTLSFSTAPESEESRKRNIFQFRARYESTDGLILSEPWSEEAEQLFEVYASVLREVQAQVEASGARLILAYCPSYDQLFSTTPPMRITAELKETAERFKITFIDYTEPLRKAGLTKRLHFTPIDYHLTPAGYQVMADVLSAAILGSYQKELNR